MPDSLRPPAPMVPPPRDPVLALPPREGRALLRLSGVFGAILMEGGIGRGLPRRVLCTKSRVNREISRRNGNGAIWREAAGGEEYGHDD